MLPKLDSTLFTFELWKPDCWDAELNCWDALDLSFSESLELDKLLSAIKQYGIGYCDGGSLFIEPRADYYAVMCEKDGYKFWFHVFKDDLDNLI